VNGNQFGMRNLRANNPSVPPSELIKVELKKSIEMTWWGARHPSVNHHLHLLVVFGLRMRVHIATAFVTADISVKSLTDVPQLMKHSREFLIQRDLKKTWQIKTQNIEELVAALVKQALARVVLAVSNRGEFPALKAHGSQRSIQSVGHSFARLAIGNSNTLHLNVRHRRQSSCHVTAESPHVGSEIEAILPNGV